MVFEGDFLTVYYSVGMSFHKLCWSFGRSFRKGCRSVGGSFCQSIGRLLHIVGPAVGGSIGRFFGLSVCWGAFWSTSGSAGSSLGKVGLLVFSFSLLFCC